MAYLLSAFISIDNIPTNPLNIWIILLFCLFFFNKCNTASYGAVWIRRLRFTFVFFFSAHAFRDNGYCSWTVAVVCWLFNTFISPMGPVNSTWDLRFHFSAIFSLKINLTTLFTHLKIISLQRFQFSVFSFSKISSIQTDPMYMTIRVCLLRVKIGRMENKENKIGWKMTFSTV